MDPGGNCGRGRGGRAPRPASPRPHHGVRLTGPAPAPPIVGVIPDRPLPTYGSPHPGGTPGWIKSGSQMAAPDAQRGRPGRLTTTRTQPGRATHRGGSATGSGCGCHPPPRGAVSRRPHDGLAGRGGARSTLERRRPGRQNLRVAQALQRVDGKLIFKEPKTAKSRRTLRIPQAVVEALRVHRDQQELRARGGRRSLDRLRAGVRLYGRHAA